MACDKGKIMTEFPKTLFGFYIKYGVKPFVWTLVPWFFLAVIWRLIDSVFGPYLQKSFLALFDKPLPAGTGIDFALPLILVIAVTIVVSVMIHIWDDVLWMRLKTKTENHFSEILNKYAHNQSMTFWTGRIIGKTNEQINFLKNGFNILVTAVVVFSYLLIILLNFGLILQVNKQIALVFIITMIFYVVYSVWRAKSLGRAYKKYSKSASSLGGQLIDSMSNFLPVKLFARNKQEHIHIKPLRQRVINERLYAGMMDRIFWSVPEIIVGILFATILFLCARLYLLGEMQVSEIAFTITMNFIITHNISKIISDTPNVAERLGAASQSYTELIAPVAITDAPNAPELKVSRGSVEIRDVTFKYNKKLVLNDLSLTIKPGEKVGLVGASGAGKTTLVNLLMRLYEPVRGAIFIDGQDIKSVTQNSLRENIAFIPQDTTMFNRTIKDNIGYGKIGATDTEIKRAAKQASADKFIMDTTEKYNTMVGDRGIKLSGGQRQRIAIARAFLKNAPILILDEATAALDSETEAVIQKSFEELSRGRTTIAIAHRLSTLRNMDRIVVIDKGKIVETGKPTQLLRKRDGIYARLWKMQSGGFIQE
jgi:ABC-type multidrug transport system fused ATPase/permease subunit